MIQANNKVTHADIQRMKQMQKQQPGRPWGSIQNEVMTKYVPTSQNDIPAFQAIHKTFESIANLFTGTKPTKK